jgi:hypothetical protein
MVTCRECSSFVAPAITIRQRFSGFSENAKRRVRQAVRRRLQTAEKVGVGVGEASFRRMPFFHVGRDVPQLYVF